jgi:hypothetical protein
MIIKKPFELISITVATGFNEFINLSMSAFLITYTVTPSINAKSITV